MDLVSGNRPFVILRYTLIVATAYLLLVERSFAMPGVGVMLLIVAALISNVAIAQLPPHVTNRPGFSAALILGDTLWITTALLTSHQFEADFFYLYFFVLLLAAIGQSLQVIALTAVVVCVAYLYVLSVNGTVLSLWHSPSLIRLPFLFTTAAFYGYLIDRARRDQRRARSQAFADLERLVAQRTAELTAANHELAAFAYSVSHDLRAPLRAIDAFSQALIEDFGAALEARAQDYLRRIRNNTVRMGQLIDDLLKLSRLTRAELHFETVDLTAMARQITTDLQRAESDRTVACTIEPGVIARGDPRLLRVLLENLLGNAWKYTSRHATARIEFGRTTTDGETAYFVRDDGAGFDPTQADKLFRPFQRLHTTEEFEGAGVGLATAQRVVRRHGGQIWADAAPEQGATFFFTLSAAAEDTTAPPARLATAA